MDITDCDHSAAGTGACICKDKSNLELSYVKVTFWNSSRFVMSEADHADTKFFVCISCLHCSEALPYVFVRLHSDNLTVTLFKDMLRGCVASGNSRLC